MPSTLAQASRMVFYRRCKTTLIEWLEQAKKACDVRFAANREMYEKARHENISNLLRNLNAIFGRKGGVLDKYTIRAVLGKRQVKQRLWGISGKTALGIRFFLEDSL